MGRRLGESLVAAGHLTERQLDEALEAQRLDGGTLGGHLIRLGFVHEDTVGAALAQMHGVPTAQRVELAAAADAVVALLPADYVRRHRAFPFLLDGEDLHLALQNPSDSLALHEAAFLTGLRIVPHVVPELVLRESIAHHFAPRPARAGGAASHAAPPAPQAPGVPDALREVGGRLAAADSRDAVLAIALDEVARYFPRAAVLAVRGPEAVVWRTRGFPAGTTRHTVLPLDDGSLLGEALRGVPSYGPVPATPPNQDLYILLGGTIPRAAFASPVAIAGRPVVLLYGDDPTGAALPPDFARLRRVALMVAWALEAVILHAKILRESGA